jgi:hypothetical protein
VLLFSTIALVLFVLLMTILRGTRTHDDRAAARLDGVSTAALALEGLRRDAWTSRQVVVSDDGEGVRFWLPVPGAGTGGPDVAYRWSAASVRRLLRNGERVGGSALAAFAARTDGRLLTMELSATTQAGQGRAVRMVTNLLVRGPALRAQHPEWCDPPGDGPGT